VAFTLTAAVTPSRDPVSSAVRLRAALVRRVLRRRGTPIVVHLLSGVVSTIVMLLAFALTSGNAGKYFSVVLGLAISNTTIAYVLVFPALIKLR
jgi:amino acid transporter